MKKFLVVIMALVMCFTTITTAFAADATNATIDKILIRLWFSI